MEKITFFEDVGGFIITPKEHTLQMLMEKERNWTPFILRSVIIILLSSVFAGCVLMFYMMYPEVFFVPNAEHTGRLFVYAAAHPLFIIAMLGLGIIFVTVVDILIQGSISYWITKKTLKASNRTKELSYSRFIAMYSFSQVYLSLFYMITVLWMFFFEKFAYTKIFFPVTDLSLPVIIHFSILFITMLMKWVWEIQFKKGIFEWADIDKLKMRESIIISLCVRLWIVAVIFMILFFSGNLIAGAQWS